MRRLDKSYPYQQPSKNRSSKNLNMIIGRASVFPAYLAWSDKDLDRFAKKCKNLHNPYRETLDARIAERAVKAKRRPAKKPESKI